MNKNKSRQLDLSFDDKMQNVLQYVLTWPQWNALLIIGGDYNHREHIGITWAKKAHAATVLLPKMNLLSSYNINTNILTNQNFFIHEIDRIQHEEELLFHLIDNISSVQNSLLLTCCSLEQLQTVITIQDLQSRLISMPRLYLDI